LIALSACQPKATASTESDKSIVEDSVRAVLHKVIAASNSLDFKKAVVNYSSDADAVYIENGSRYTFQEFYKMYEEMGPNLEVLENKFDDERVTVLSNDAALVTAAFHFKIKAKGGPEYNGSYQWSGVIQKRNSKWLIINSHESWLNFAEAMKALTPPAAN
jgi:ketosteroid isomerase-like protein